MPVCSDINLPKKKKKKKKFFKCRGALDVSVNERAGFLSCMPTTVKKDKRTTHNF